MLSSLFFKNHQALTTEHTTHKAARQNEADLITLTQQNVEEYIYLLALVNKSNTQALVDSWLNKHMTFNEFKMFVSHDHSVQKDIVAIKSVIQPLVENIQDFNLLQQQLLTIYALIKTNRIQDVSYFINTIKAFSFECEEGRFNALNQCITLLTTYAANIDINTLYWNYINQQLSQQLTLLFQTIIPEEDIHPFQLQHVSRNIKDFFYAHNLGDKEARKHFHALSLPYDFCIYQWLLEYFDSEHQAELIYQYILQKNVFGLPRPKLTDHKDIGEIQKNRDHIAALISEQRSLLHMQLKKLFTLNENPNIPFLANLIPKFHEYIITIHPFLANYSFSCEATKLIPFPNHKNYFIVLSDNIQSDLDNSRDYLPPSLLIYSTTNPLTSNCRVYLGAYNPDQLAYEIHRVKTPLKELDEKTTLTLTQQQFETLPQAILEFDHYAEVVPDAQQQTLPTAKLYRQQLETSILNSDEQFGAKFDHAYQRQRFINAWGYFMSGRFDDKLADKLIPFPRLLIEHVSNQMIMLKLRLDRAINKKVYNKNECLIAPSLYRSFHVFANQASLWILLNALNEKAHRAEPGYLLTFTYYILTAKADELAYRLERADAIYLNPNLNMRFIDDGPSVLNLINIMATQSILHESALNVFAFFMEFLSYLPSNMDNNLANQLFRSIHHILYKQIDNGYSINYLFECMTEITFSLVQTQNTHSLMLKANFNHLFIHEFFRTSLIKYLKDHKHNCSSSLDKFKTFYNTLFIKYYPKYQLSKYNSFRTDAKLTKVPSWAAEYMGIQHYDLVYFNELINVANINVDKATIQAYLASVGLDTFFKDGSAKHFFCGIYLQILDKLHLKHASQLNNLIFKILLYQHDTSLCPPNLLKRLMNAYHNNDHIHINNFNRLFCLCVVIAGLVSLYSAVNILGGLLVVLGLLLFFYPQILIHAKQKAGLEAIHLPAQTDIPLKTIWLSSQDVSFFKKLAFDQNCILIDEIFPTPLY